MSGRVRARLPVGLVAVLALLYVWVGVTAHGWDRLWGVGGGLLVLGALLLLMSGVSRSRPAAVVVLAVGALPLAVATWWSIATPLLAVLVLVIGGVVVRRSGARGRAIGSPAGA